MRRGLRSFKEVTWRYHPKSLHPRSPHTANLGPSFSSQGQNCLSSMVASPHPIEHFDDFEGVFPSLTSMLKLRWESPHPTDMAKTNLRLLAQCHCPRPKWRLPGLLSNSLNGVKRCSVNSSFDGNLVTQLSAKNSAFTRISASSSLKGNLLWGQVLFYSSGNLTKMDFAHNRVRPDTMK